MSEPVALKGHYLVVLALILWFNLIYLSNYTIIWPVSRGCSGFKLGHQWLAPLVMMYTSNTSNELWDWSSLFPSKYGKHCRSVDGILYDKIFRPTSAKRLSSLCHPKQISEGGFTNILFWKHPISNIANSSKSSYLVRDLILQMTDFKEKPPPHPKRNSSLSRQRKLLM